MKHTLPRLTRWISSLCLATLTACGGGGSGDTPAPQPTTGKVVFWVSGSNVITASDPAVVIVGTSQVGSITVSRASAPSTFNLSPDLAWADLAAGTYSYRAYTASGQFWTGSVTLTNGQNTLIELRSQNTGRVTFWANSIGNTNNANIRIILDGIDTLGTISTRRTAAPACGSTTSFVRPVGNYSYIAMSVDNKCQWSGSINITAGGCTLQELAACN